jgi:hypothetical protein
MYVVCLYTKLGHDDFNTTGGCLSRWKCRHDIKFKKARIVLYATSM